MKAVYVRWVNLEKWSSVKAPYFTKKTAVFTTCFCDFKGFIGDSTRADLTADTNAYPTKDSE